MQINLEFTHQLPSRLHKKPPHTVSGGFGRLAHVIMRVQINLEFTHQLPSRLHEKFPRASGLLGHDQPGSLSDQGLDLLRGLLRLNPAKRLTAAEALEHPW